MPDGKTREDYLRELCYKGLRERYGERATTDPELTRAARLRARRSRENRVRQLHPDRLGFHPFREGTRNSGRPGPRFGRRFDCRLRPRNHRHRSAAVRFDLRAIFESGSRFAARYRCRFLRSAPRRSPGIRPPEIRRTPRRADHHVRKTEGEKRGARRRPGDRAGAIATPIASRR